MKELEIEDLKKRIYFVYRKQKTLLMRAEKKDCETPSEDFKLEIRERAGFLRGLMKAIELIRVRPSG